MVSKFQDSNANKREFTESLVDPTISLIALPQLAKGEPVSASRPGGGKYHIIVEIANF